MLGEPFEFEELWSAIEEETKTDYSYAKTSVAKQLGKGGGYVCDVVLGSELNKA